MIINIKKFKIKFLRSINCFRFECQPHKYEMVAATTLSLLINYNPSSLEVILTLIIIESNSYEDIS